MASALHPSEMGLKAVEWQIVHMEVAFHIVGRKIVPHGPAGMELLTKLQSQ